MELNLEKHILDIAEQANEKLGGCLKTSTLRCIEHPDEKAGVADSTLAFYADGIKRKDDVVIIISNPQFPKAVSSATRMATSVAHRLDPEARRHVLLPLIEGTFGHQSYAVFPKLEELSDRRWLRYLQKKYLGPKVFSWLEVLALQTRQYCNNSQTREASFLRPLSYLIHETAMSTDIQKFAECCFTEISSNSVTLSTVVEHGDFWLGNLLLEREYLPHVGAFYGKFLVIDWGGARLEGYPCIDIVRYCLSTNRNMHSSARTIRKYADRMGMSSFEVGLHCMSSLGYLGLNRNQFPMDRYTILVESVFDFLCRYGFTASSEPNIDKAAQRGRQHTSDNANKLS